MNDDWATIRARRVLEKLSDGAAMNERVEEIRRKFYTTFPNPDVLTGETATAIRDLLAALAQAEQERTEHEDAAVRLLAQRDDEIVRVRAEVERLKGELNEAKEEVRRQVEVRVLDQGRHHVDLQETSSQIVPESLCSCGESLRELEADLARVRAALQAFVDQHDGDMQSAHRSPSIHCACRQCEQARTALEGRD